MLKPRHRAPGLPPDAPPARRGPATFPLVGSVTLREPAGRTFAATITRR